MTVLFQMSRALKTFSIALEFVDREDVRILFFLSTFQHLISRSKSVSDSDSSFQTKNAGPFTQIILSILPGVFCFIKGLHAFWSDEFRSIFPQVFQVFSPSSSQPQRLEIFASDHQTKGSFRDPRAIRSVSDWSHIRKEGLF